MSEHSRRSGERRANGDRRRAPRRSEDIRHALRRQARNPVLVALALLSAVLLVAFAALLVQRESDHQATQKAEHAAGTASAALSQATTALDAVRAQQERQRLQLRQGCQRLNIQRASENHAHLGQYKVDRVVLIFTKAAPVRRRTRRFLRAFLPQLGGAVSQASWTPLTDCLSAVAEHGPSYRAPRPVAFVSRLPPRSALDPRNAALPNPVGSVP